ncbi:hypothetical protein VSH64_24965 [Amycolatopsis rhabdoformis]|uniref:Ig-like domain-containing protein n=1 Tax=Amycolatopsis rhabdoformis TaxID=1448059 RepID=A0ABZ1HUX0_9PSEU|nr:hypothetical protein [Amycolatopsis rhabdoformis]WSE26130.1 hypothetical protein VSH64_24965 [Amycolatopsis rhabdoformis]
MTADVEITWRPLRGQTEPDVVTLTKDSLDAARSSALSLACCAGALRIRVTDEHGATRFTWDRSDNLFRTVREGENR